MEKLYNSLCELDYKTLLILCEKEGITHLKNKAVKNQKYEDAAKYRDWEIFVDSEEYEKLLSRKKFEEREKKLKRI